MRAYFVITYVVSWSYWLLIHGLLDKDSYWWAAPGVFVPALVAIVVTEALGGRRGVRTFLRSWIRWRVPARWYVFALVALPALVVLSYVFLPDGTKGLERSPVIVGLTYLATFVAPIPPVSSVGLRLSDNKAGSGARGQGPHEFLQGPAKRGRSTPARRLDVRMVRA
ncbi:MAG TPA: hypothetical protein VFO20_13350 [Propionibacteriaceae bacterium]|nr:hypothetical protein [Propionibacteriaceae bacterium]